MKISERKILLSIFVAILTLGSASPVQSQGLAVIETDDFRLIYFDPIQSYLAPHVARCLQNSMTGVRSILGFDPKERTTVLLKDFSDYGNAAASAVPRNRLMFDVAPLLFTFETLPPNERLCLLTNHELVHVVTMDQATSSDKAARRFFAGKVLPVAKHPESMFYAYLTTPRVLTPSWYLEGSAVFMETWMAGGFGRAQGAYDEMVFRSMVRDDAYFYDPVGLESEGSKIDFKMGVNNYLYGTRLMTYLAYHYSPDKVIEWFTRREGSKRHYTAAFEQVFGMSLNEAWQDWIDFEHDFQARNLQAIREHPTTPYKDISERGLGSVSRTYFDPETRKLHWALRYPGVVAHIGNMSIDDGRTNNLVDIKGPKSFNVTSLAFDPEAKRLFYTADNGTFRDVMAVDTASGKSEMLLRDARIGELVFNKSDRSLWGVRHLNGIVTLVRIPHPYKEWSQVHSFPYGQLLYDMDISPDGQLLSTSFGEVSGDQSLRVFNIESLLQGDITPLKQFDFGQAIPEGFVFTPDGTNLYGSSYYTGISNIFRYELETEEMEAVSNAEAGFFRPTPLDDGNLLVLRYTGQGFVPTIIDPQPLDDVSAISFLGTEVIAKYPILQSWQVGSPADVPLDELITKEGEYTGFGNMGLQSIMPIIEGYKNEFALGARAVFSDPLMLENIDLSVSHSINSDLPSSEDIHAQLEWRHLSTTMGPLAGVWTTTLRHNPADFYDLFGPTKQSLKGQSASINYEKILIYDRPRELDFEIDLSHYMNLDRLPRYQNIDATFDELTTLTSILSYSHVRRSLGAVDDEKGFKWRIAASGNRVDGDSIPKFFGNFDFGVPLPWRNSSLWFRNSAGVAIGEVDDEFANFFFGGFGNNYVDSGEIKRYRNEYAMPGFELNEIGGRNFYRSMLEVNLPPIRFQEVGGSRFFLSWARPAIFATALVTNTDNGALRRTVSNVGAQVDFQFVLMSKLNMALSIGYAVGFGDNVVGSPDEFMISLKVM